MKTIQQTKISTLDPLVSHCYQTASEIKLEPNESIEDGLIWFGNDHGRRLFITGGSTSDIYVDGSWTRPFAQMMSASSVTVVSSAVSGHSSVQEFLRLYRDGIPLLPRMVISLSGINDLGFVQSSRESPFLHNYQKGIYSTFLNKKRFGFGASIRAFGGNAVTGINTGPATQLSPFRFWLSNINLMNALCNSIGAVFLSFLQPVMGVGCYKRSQEEDIHFMDYCKGSPGYESYVSEFYSEASALINNYPHITSLVDLFDGQKDCYKDARHPNSKGNRIIAKKIFSQVMSYPTLIE